jgi:hypothetical protein
MRNFKKNCQRKEKLTESSLEAAVEGGGTLLVRLARLVLVATSREENYKIKSMTIRNYKGGSYQRVSPGFEFVVAGGR